MDADNIAAPGSKATKERGVEARPLDSARNLAQYAALVGGVILLLLGWYGISGTADLAAQVPYLASATIPGASLLIAGAILVANDRSRRSQDRASAQIATLYRLLTVAVETPASAGASLPSPSLPTDDALGANISGVVVVDGGTRFHRATCALVAGKSSVSPVSSGSIDERHLEPCPICDPSRPVT